VSENPGVRLKQIRLARGVSLEEVHKKTRIHMSILRSIEGDSVSNLNSVYLKGFLKLYCKFLNVNPGEYIEQYREVQKSVVIKPKETKVEKRETVRTQEGWFLRKAYEKIGAFPAVKRIHAVIFPVVGVALVMVVLFFVGRYVAVRRTHTLTQEKTTTAEKVNKSVASKKKPLLKQ